MEGLPQETLDLIESIGDEPIPALSLGQAVYEQMLTDDIPEAHIDSMAMYALYYWTLGEQLADQIMEAASAGDGAGKAPGRSASSTSKRGRRTA